MWEKVHFSFLGLWALIELIEGLEVYCHMRSPLSMLAIIITIIRQDECAIKIRS